MKTLKSKTPKGCAFELKRYLIKKLGKEIERDIIIRSANTNPEGKHWTIIFEGGPFEWPMALNGGGDIFAWSMGQYSEVGDFPNGLSNEFVHCECRNHYQIDFYKQ